MARVDMSLKLRKDLKLKLTDLTIDKNGTNACGFGLLVPFHGCIAVCHCRWKPGKQQPLELYTMFIRT